MTKPELLKLMRLLSALESALVYSPASNIRLPGYLVLDLQDCVKLLEKEILR